MTTADSARWSPARWLAVIVAVFAAQVGAVFLMSATPDLTPPALGPSPKFALSLRTVPGAAGVAEPAAFAMANRNDFSKSAWLTRPPAEHQLSDWTENAGWWTYPTNRLTRDFQSMVKSAAITRPAARELPPQPIRAPETDDTELALLNSSVKPDALLAARGLMAPILAPEIETNDVLPPTRVQVALNQDGLVLSALVVAASGNTQADATALRLAATAQFAPARPKGSPTQVGELAFNWITVPPRAPREAAKP